ncbi:MAG: hypothetical protein AAF581_12275 [Planctomycetota bacterium]
MKSKQRQQKAGPRSAAAVVMVCLSCVVLVAGCCATVPRAEKYFDRSSPHQALRMFQYSIETSQYDAAYACLGAETRAQFSPTKFKFAIRFAALEEWDDLSLYDFIVEGRQYPSLDVARIIGEGSHGVTVAYLLDDEEGTSVEQAVTMIEEQDGLWSLDLLRIKGVHFP